MVDHRSSEGYETHFAQRRQIEQEAEQHRSEHRRRTEHYADNATWWDPSPASMACTKAGHVPGCPGRAGGDHELLPGWISYEEPNGTVVEVEVAE